VGYGHVYQGRYKSFPIETDEYFYHVVRYVEANPLRANLVASPADWHWAWHWGSLWRRERGDQAARGWLSDWPLPIPRNWLGVVASVQPTEQLEQVRRSVVRGQPYGGMTWTERTAAALGLESTLRARGRPRKVE